MRVTRHRSDVPFAIVSGADASGYGIARSLGRAGVPVASLVGTARNMGESSRYVRKTRAYPPNPAEDPEQICATLLSWRREFTSNPVLFATSDWFAIALAAHRRELEGHYLFHWTAPEIIRRLTDKSQLPELCREVGVAAPRTHVTEPGENIAASARGFTFPCIVKPTLNFNPWFRDRKNFIADTPESLIAFYEECPVAGTSVWQDFIEGGDDSIFQCTVLKGGSGGVAALSTVRKLLQYPANGMMCYGRSERNGEVESAALKFMDALDYRGIASLEFKYRAREQRYFFFEINVRLPWYSGMFADAGVDLPLLAYQDLVGTLDSRPLQPVQRDGVHWICLENCLRREIGSGTSPLRAIVRSLILASRATSFSWWNWRDPVPWAADTLRLIRVTAGRLLETLKKTRTIFRRT